MGIKKVKPNTPGRRQSTFDDFKDITSVEPQKRLVLAKKRASGRNNQGKITVRHRGGGVKRNIRIVDAKRDKFDVPARVTTIEYDPNRGARLALLVYTDGEKRYMAAPQGLSVGTQVMSSKKMIEIKIGNAMPVEFIPAGIAICNIEIVPGFGAKVARGAGNSAFVMGIEGAFAQIKMPSGEIRLIKKECLCTVGQISNPDKSLIVYGKAGRTRRRGIKPTVTGKDMNPVDHPHGGGEGHQPIGLKYPKTPWGKHALGVKTRHPKKKTNRLIIQRRKKK